MGRVEWLWIEGIYLYLLNYFNVNSDGEFGGYGE